MTLTQKRKQDDGLGSVSDSEDETSTMALMRKRKIARDDVEDDEGEGGTGESSVTLGGDEEGLAQPVSNRSGSADSEATALDTAESSLMLADSNDGTIQRRSTDGEVLMSVENPRKELKTHAK